MSTHAAIIAKTKDGIYQGCYLHFDGYPTHVAPVLKNDFNTADLAGKLVSMGMVESITLGGFITPWEDKESASTTFGATIEEIANKMSVFHVYVFDQSWTYDKIPLVNGRRKSTWKYRGHTLEDVAPVLRVPSELKTIHERPPRK